MQDQAPRTDSDTDGCDAVAEAVVDFVAGALPAARSASISAHAAACAPCATTVAREGRLQALLAAIPDAPDTPLRLPSLTDPRDGRILRLRFAWSAAAVAAAVLAAWVVLPDAPPIVTGPDLGALRVVDVDDGGALAWDDGLLGLVAGAEAVASRRLAESR